MSTAADIMYYAPVDVNVIILPGKTNVEGKPAAQSPKPQVKDKDLPPMKNVFVENGRRKIVRQNQSDSGSEGREQSWEKYHTRADGNLQGPDELHRGTRARSVVDIEDSSLFEEDLNLRDPKPEFPGPYDPERVRVLYRAACEMLNVVPSSRFQRSVNSGRVEAGYQGWGPLGTRAVAISLVTALTVTELHIPGNRLGPDGMQCMSKLIQGNEVIKVLDVSENDLGREGGKVLAQAIAENESIQEFRASGNKFDDPTGVYLGSAIKVNSQIRELDLSRNMFSEAGAVAIAKALEENQDIAYLDLSYNHLRPKGIKGIAKMLTKNTGLLNLNLSWNGIGTDGAKVLGEAFNHNNTLACLGFNGCRLNLESLLSFLKRMPGNTCLKALEIVDNPLTSADMCLFMRSMKMMPDLNINFVDASSVMVSSDFLGIVKEIEVQKPGFVVMYRGLLSIKDVSKNMLQNLDMTGGDPLEAIIKYCRLKNLRLVDLFARFDQDKSGSMTRQELIQGVASAGIPLTIQQMDKLVAKLDKDGDGEIDFAELLDGYKRYMRNLHKQGIVARDMLKADAAFTSVDPQGTLSGKSTTEAKQEKRGSIPTVSNKISLMEETPKQADGSSEQPAEEQLGGESQGQEKSEQEPDVPQDAVLTTGNDVGNVGDN